MPIAISAANHGSRLADFYRYFKSGEFQRWVAEIARGEKPKIDPGPPLTDPPGPTELITETRAAK